MKPMPISSMHAEIVSGDVSIFTPRAVKTSALPARLDDARPPCLAMKAPPAAATKAAAVEILNVFFPSPPVPQGSTIG